MMTNKKMQVLFLGVLILIAVVLTSSFVGAASKTDNTIGYVDMSRLQAELPDYLKLKDLMKDKESEFNLFRGYIYQQQQNATKELEKKANADKAGKSTNEQASIDKKLQDDVKKKTDEMNGQLQQKLSEIQKNLNDQQAVTLDKVKKLISQVAEEKKLTLVVEKSVCLYGGNDITQAVIDKAKKLEETSNNGKDDKKTGSK